ncbi:hypothetical protein DFH07DRAFT_840632 [Mycena maculata]|uniref:UBC core domain-containing protein n=1 Tax=Mycena maculata TaxID=230809 RepID=A0AAD7MYW5_9AGAR|nr:hypothetical protein DFH07DRAFT_840632 [Mycena maculata]
MDPQRRRILVAFEDDSDHPRKRQQKIALSIDKNATNFDLAREVANAFQQTSVTLEISGGFELREKDGIDMIGENEVVTARVNSSSRSSDTVQLVPSIEIDDAHLDPVDRYKIGFVTAEHALAHAKQTPREQSEATNGIYAFDGHIISGSTTLRDLEREAARVLHWSSPDSMDVDDGPCDHDDQLICSCPIAQEIERHGLSDTLHCRFTVDGSMCGNAECPYSHAALTDSSMPSPPHCSLCDDALGFPCPACLTRAQNAGEELASVLFCPLVQNAGCGHLHHAHCVGPRHDPSTVTLGCPSGCPAHRSPREAVDWNMMRTPYLTVVWDGANIAKIPVPLARDGVSRNESLVTITTDAVVALIERFLEEKQVTLPGLSLRIHFRDPVFETVRFAQSTLVSVCPASSHLNPGHRRFPLFSAKVRAVPGSRVAPYSIDLHTSHAPIVACGCTPIRRLLSPRGSSDPVWLYAVKRTTLRPDVAPESAKRGVVSKESMFLDDAAWQPRVAQTPRGMAALLSSLYLFAHSVAQKGVAVEQRVLALAYAVLRFPPAVRTLAELLLNKVPRPEDKAALAEALFHALDEFSSRGPDAITSREKRRFETVRIFLAYIASAADGESQATPQRPVEEISLVCAMSRKRLTDPVSLDSGLVERAVAMLYQPGGSLYRPNSANPVSPIVELSPTDPVLQLLPCLPALRAPSALFLRVQDIGWPPRAFMCTLDTAARDFVAAIRRANQTDLVSQGPLELKSVEVIAPRIVVDQEGLLAVFTGRGCGTSRDVNFFRPTNGGDTEVDVNDVSHAQQNIIKERTAEDTWQVDSFGGVSNVARPPDEAIVLCLDLSESMNKQSGVRTSEPTTQEAAFDLEAEANAIVTECVREMPDSEVLDSAKAYLRPRHAECHHPWTTLSNRPGQRGEDLLRRLAELVTRKLVKLSLGRAGNKRQDPRMQQLSCFIRAASDISMKEDLRTFLIQLLDSHDVAMIGIEPFCVPRKFVDFRSGELLTDPVHPNNAPPQVFVNSTSRQWLEQGIWPAGHSVPSDLQAPQLKNAVAAWVAGKDLVPKFDLKSKVVVVTLRHHGETTSWRLLRSTTTRMLYSLAHRATSARHSEFALQISTSNSNRARTTIEESVSLSLQRTGLSEGGTVEMVRCLPHSRRTLDVEIPCTYAYIGPSLRMVVPQDSSVLTVMSCVDAWTGPWAGGIPGFTITDIVLWHGLKDCGDGVRRGSPLNPDEPIRDRADSSNLIALECKPWMPSSGPTRARDESRHLTRLHLLKELFNVFLNRASSFDTAVSLVLGLVTFSNNASQDQELTPIFENFRQSLDSKEAGGDTAIYQALDSARQMLTQYRPGLPNLRKRIIIVSDGEDTSSTTSAQEVCLALQRARVIVDSVQVGSRSDPVLHSISVATGGYRFSPNTSLADALSIFDLETMLYSGERPLRKPKPLVGSDFILRSYGSLFHHPIDTITVDKFPPRADHPLLQKPVKSAANSVRMTGSGDDRLRRIMREIKAVLADPHPAIDVYVNDETMSFLKVILEAPTDVENCPYKGGTFLLTCDLPAGYPRDPPEVRFATFIMHPNVSKQGKVCIAELGRLWSSDITLKEIFSLVYGMLLTPDLENPLEIQASLKYYEDDGTYALAVAETTAKHASKSRAQWKQELDQ